MSNKSFMKPIHFIYSIIVNLIIARLFIIFVMQPMNKASKVIAEIVCQNWKQKCNFGEIK